MRPEIKYISGGSSASPFRSDVWAVIGWKGYVVAYCFNYEAADVVWRLELARQP